jgi:hypothetical protein
VKPRLVSRATFAFQASVPSAKPTVARSEREGPPSRSALRRTASARDEERRLVSRISASWNQIAGWLSYTYRAGAQFPLGQVFEARILRRLNLGW